MEYATGFGRGGKRDVPARQAPGRGPGRSVLLVLSDALHPMSTPDSAPQEVPSATPRAILAIRADSLWPLEKLIR